MAADKLPKTERKNTSPTMAKFYRVDGSGESKTTKVTAPTLSQEQKEEPEAVKKAPAKSKRKPAKKKSSNDAIKIRIKRGEGGSKSVNRQDEWQCERAGLYYTKDGRCVVPYSKKAKRINPTTGPRRIR